jgi:hypothetical protein
MIRAAEAKLQQLFYLQFSASEPWGVLIKFTVTREQSGRTTVIVVFPGASAARLRDAGRIKTQGGLSFPRTSSRKAGFPRTLLTKEQFIGIN